MMRWSFRLLLPGLAVALVGAAPQDAPPPPAPSAPTPDDDTRIVGGERAPAGSAPWQAEIYSTYQYQPADLDEDTRAAPDRRNYLAEKAPWERAHRCGAAYIGDGWLLSAAHCFVGVQANVLTGWRIRLGTQELSPPEKGVTFAIDRVAYHKDFVNAEPYANDIALIRIKADRDTRPLPSARYAPIRPQLPGDRPVMAFDRLVVTGWGRTKPREAVPGALARDATINHASPALLQIVIKLQDTDCRAVPEYAAVPRDTTLCAGGQVVGAQAMTRTVGALGLPAALLNRVVMDACNGDSGGPMTRAQGNERVLVGLVSWGKGCGVAGVPGIYTKVSAFAPWIAMAKLKAEPGKIGPY